MSVHLPLGVLGVAVLFELLRFLPMRSAAFFSKVSLLLLLIGVPSAWLTVYLGEVAEDMVNKLICDPTATHEHEDMAMLASYLFSAALTLKLALYLFGGALKELVSSSILRFALNTGPLLLMLTGAAYLVYTGHLGATLVYNQGAGVYKPGSDCREFE